ncbi:hypothetical protein F5Y18DRAFT_281527 [Xylariaceae sp. FL1019]|nr:hypothetical protein F5Y18DRAFT_281527 [Xylariaceae sp. FL1019]
MTHVRDPFLDLEKHLQQLEEQVDKLVIALDEWRQWKTDYEALRADVQDLPSAATREALSQTRQAFRGELVNDKELIDIFGPNDAKKPHQILSTVSNRLDYVSKNIDTLARQLEAAEDKLAATRVVSNPEATDEDGLPITEIMEELDDDDNVVSYNLRRPADGQQQLLEVLEKAGIQNLPSISSAKPNPDILAPAPVDLAENEKAQPKILKSESASKSEKESEKAPKKKSVAFAEDTKITTEMRLADPDPVKRLEELYRQAKDQDSIITDPIMPADETAEDAALREDMIRYNKQTLEYEMGPIVAELNLEEGSDFDEDDWGYDEEESEDDEDDEDGWGRSTSGVMDDEYRRQMGELRERITQRSLGKRSAKGEDDEFSEGIGRITIKQATAETVQGKQDTTSQISPEKDVKKAVRFATSLDSVEHSSPPTQQVPKQPKKPEIDPLSDVVERSSTAPTKPGTASRKRASRFRRERASEGPNTPSPAVAPEKPTSTIRYAPSGPEGRTIASDILEHEPTNEIREPDEFDANLLHQQVTEEYYKMRNRMINRQGGFLKEDESPIQPLEEDEGGPKRVSRFKAARLAKP